MAEVSLATTYARAVFEKALEKFKRDLTSLNSALTKSNLGSRLDNPAESFDGKKALLNGLLPPDADNEIRNLAYLLASKNEVHLLGEIVSEFDRMAAEQGAGATAQITTTIDMTAEEKTQLEDKLRQQFGQDLSFEYRLDPSILGGVVVRVGDVVIDGSVTGKLAVMKQKLGSAR